jgi:hypothetical protein
MTLSEITIGTFRREAQCLNQLRHSVPHVQTSTCQGFGKHTKSIFNLQEVGRGRGDWMELAQDRDRWRALVGTVRDFRVPLLRGIS